MKRLLLVIFILLTFYSCKKEDEKDWVYCNDCTYVNWLGEYKGDGALFTEYNPDETKKVQVNMEISELDEDSWKIEVSSDNNFIISFYGLKASDGYYYDLAGTSKEIHLTLYRNGEEYKISGNAKVYRTIGDSVVLNKSVSFDVYR